MRVSESDHMPRREFITCGLFAALSAYVAARNAVAQGSYPEKTVRILVGFPSGGPPDVASRLLAEKFSAAWGNPVVVENVTGAGGNIAIDRAIKAAPDGYTLVMASSAITINPSLLKTSYDPIRDLAPISMAVFTPSILVVNNELPARNVQELIALARSQPGKLTYGHAGTGTPAHLSGELFKSLAGIDVAPVPYRGIPALLPDLLAGRVSMALPNMSVVLPLVREGNLRALAAISPTRATAMPDLPTMDEEGLPGFDVLIWFGLMAPAGTSQSIIARLHQETVRALTASDVRKRFGDAGMEVVANTPTEFAAVIKSELPQWAKLIKEGGIKVSD
jgi:tripartite-type tricarboxylate transporter receptor subunit TctC